MNKTSEQEYICCIPFNNLIIEKVSDAPIEENDICICKALLKEPVKDVTTEQGIQDITINQILMSEGSTIFESKSLTFNHLQTFEHFNIPGIKKINIWYHLIKLLTGSDVLAQYLDVKLDSAYWKFEIQGLNQCNLVFQMASETIVKKMAEISFTSVENAELDLFDLTNRLFQRFRNLNETHHKIKEEFAVSSIELSTLTSERKILDKILDERDKKTKTVVVELLNEKKKKIFHLEQLIESKGFGNLLPESKPDSEVINTHILDAVNELNSPGKRRKIRAKGSSDKGIKRKLKYEDILQRDSLKKEKIEGHEFSPEFNFYGISKLPTEDPNIFLQETIEPLVKVEPGEESLNTSDESDDVKVDRKYLTKSITTSDFESETDADNTVETKGKINTNKGRNSHENIGIKDIHNKGNYSTSDSDVETETSDF
ncbi:similar to Saccharomyces cerevisiae YGL090W LIF1 Component of the DNA ligase IV complex that mediates nonhomologous end joining in DNA double-strand break repair [Maudiozyma barnettii]|uniref:Similar to Saccharomyces cerevisiae YGL090W LIF1 Component of the DNA ligase IV complex that mediates nonhomologous end joining in DNA double-strand break repair n=1 Tax=Maudiozyma barnettii TaxID=61262 RepID=A0A8H2ZJI4_9SACH|nr:Lif1p [Kazachstania barnettii]CAB4254272.1 similar to Saccharomyces cerevisiae YGL090W LIF1 Component of the DNA ligase IV complex that mediates nonhomologous end joining in DNA double-strand break repair [Kazachstania barnettii]CAD1782055.1 similar to Saccharomyces cerevisiae YGL090W LIF1 Component of the DNA ligase IV complex that mediates nonhomologous end joining in DNA double-strand break repair [Kazachstania barnettii]